MSSRKKFCTEIETTYHIDILLYRPKPGEIIFVTYVIVCNIVMYRTRA